MIGYDTDGFFYENKSPSDLKLSFKNEDEFKVVLSNIIRITGQLFELINIKDENQQVIFKKLLDYSLKTDHFFPQEVFKLSESNT